jgi:hypothetical protein
LIPGILLEKAKFKVKLGKLVFEHICLVISKDILVVFMIFIFDFYRKYFICRKFYLIIRFTTFMSVRGVDITYYKL